MRSRLPIARAAAAMAALLLALPHAARAQPRPTRPDVPRHYAITGARIFTVSGPALERGTVVVRDGVITGVGRDVEVPAGAWVIPGEGKTVYPGFVDALTNLGHPSPRPARSAAAGGESPFGPQEPIDESKHSWGPEDRPGTHSHRSAAEGLDTSDARIPKWRGAGFTTVVSTRDEGLVTGQAAVLALGDYQRPREMVVATPVAMHLKLEDRSYTGFPNSLMGSFAYLKQLYLDARHYDRVWDAYEAAPRGKPRPEWDPALEPIRRQLEAGYPVLFPAADRKEILRAVATAREMGVKVVVYGAQGAYDAADVLAGVSVVVDLNWPSAPRDADPQEVPTLAVLRMRDRSPTTPAELHRAGVRFAFSSGGLGDPAEVWANVRKAVDRGLPREGALRALTLSAAEIYGVADRLGSVEVGKLGNLVVASGDIFEEGTRVETVLVDGERFEVPAPEEARDAAAPGAARERRGEAAGATRPVPLAKDKGPFRDDPVTLIRNATVMTASRGTLANSDVLMRDGKIAEVGRNLTAPAGARVVDGTGKWVTPGIIDAHSHIATDAVNEGSVNVSSMVTIRDVINPGDPSIYYALAGGVTTVNVFHGSANPVGGGSAVLKLRWGSDAGDMLMSGVPEGVKFALGENVKRDRNPDRYPATRMGAQDVIRQAFLDADVYRRAWDAWEAGGRRGLEPRRDLKLERLANILRGRSPIHAHAYRADEMLQIMRLAEEFGVTVRSFEHGLEAYRIADEMAAHGASLSTFSDWWAFKVEAYDAIPYNAALAEERGVLVSIKSDSEEEMRHLNQEAAKAMKWGGMSEERALRLVTLNPAKQLRIDDRTGSLDPGKDADVVVWDGPPLSVFAKPLQTYVDGKLYFDRDLDLERQRAVAAEKEALLERQRRPGEVAR